MQTLFIRPFQKFKISNNVAEIEHLVTKQTQVISDKESIKKILMNAKKFYESNFYFKPTHSDNYNKICRLLIQMGD